MVLHAALAMVAAAQMHLVAASESARSAKGAFAFASVFGDDMVLQRDIKAGIYGTAPPGAAVTVAVSGGAPGVGVEDDAPVTVTASASGHWKALLPARPAGTAHTITAATKSGGPALKLARVAYGDVFFCSGQSNMELGLFYTLNRNESAAAVSAGKYANIRLLHFDHNPQPHPQYVTNGSIATTGNSSWLTPAAALADKHNAGTMGDCASVFGSFSAACWYFGAALSDRMLAEEQQQAQAAAGGGSGAAVAAAAAVPIGLIESAFGGTCIESWLSAEDQLACSNITCTSGGKCGGGKCTPYTKDNMQACAAVPPAHNGAGANAELFNGMVLPFVNMSVKGYLWYQVSARS